MPDQNQKSPFLRLLEITTGHWIVAAVYSLTKLKLADEMSRDEWKHSDALADAVAADRSSVYRLLRALSSLDVVRERSGREFALTEIGDYLRSDHPNSMRDMVLFQGAPPQWQGWGSLLHSIKTGKSSFEHVHGEGFFDYCAKDAEFSAAFDGAMTAMTTHSARQIYDLYDFTAMNSLCDVGGGQGLLLAEILQNTPQLQGILFDLPHVIESASKRLWVDLSERCRLVGGDFFAELPPADAYIIKHIIHDWDDSHASKILTNMRRGLHGDGPVLVVETVLTDDMDHHMPTFMDLEMLQATRGGRERTLTEYEALFATAGLQLTNVVRSKAFFSILEARRIED